MGHSNKTRGLTKRGQVWHINKVVNGRRICESTGTASLTEAEKYLAKRLEEIRQADIYGVRPKRTFRQAATKYLQENQHKRCIADDALQLKLLDAYLGHLPLESISMNALQPYIQARQAAGLKTRTINHSIAVVRKICNLAAAEWMDALGLTWLHQAPKFKLLPEPDLRQPLPLSWEQQDEFFDALPDHLREMALFKVNTGCREKEVCRLQWEWEYEIPGTPMTVFIIPKEHVKNGKERLVVLNQVAAQVVHRQRGIHPTYVFTYQGHPILRMNNTAWQRVQKRMAMPLRVHDLKHTFGRRLRAAGVSFEDRQDLLGHRSGRITTHYSAAEIQNLIDAANLVCDRLKSSPVVRLLTARTAGQLSQLAQKSRKAHSGVREKSRKSLI